MIDLPPGWTRTPVGDIAEVRGGIQKQAKRRPVNNRYPFLRVANVGRGMLNLEEVHEIELFDGELDRFAIQAGDLLVVEGNGSPGEIGRAAMWHGEILNCVHQNHLICVRPTSALLPRFLELLWSSPEIEKQLREVASSTSGLYTLSTSKIKAVKICLPPFEEQCRIVATLEDHMSRLDAATHNVNQAAAWIMQLRRSVYGYVASGRIMSNSDNSHSASSELVNGWIWVDPDEVTSGSRKDITIGPFGSDLRVADYKEDGIPLVFVRNIRSGIFGKSSTRYISQEKADKLRAHEVIQGDVLITKMGEPPGDSCVYTSATPGIITADCIRLRPGRTWDSRYLSIAINSPLVRAQIARITRGIAQRKVSLGRFRAEVKIPVPPPALQSEVVDEAERLLSLVGSLEEALVLALKRRDSLRRALFTEAFAGRLVPQDTADEPAALLLERLRSRGALQPSVRRGRGTAKHALQEETLL
jgi:type I restriction enzyme S subunit